MRPYESDGLTAYRQLPMVVVLPETTNSAGLARPRLLPCRQTGSRWCRAAPARRSSGGALPLGGGVLLGMAKFNRVREIDFDNRVAVVRARTSPTSRSRAAVAQAGFYPHAPDPSSRDRLRRSAAT